MKKILIALVLSLVFGALALWQTSSNSLDAQSSARLRLGDPMPQNLFVELAKLINPSVVTISTTAQPRMSPGGGRRGLQRDPFFDFFEQFMGPRMQRQPQQAMGTGFIIRKDGLILTNNHVVEGADVIKVQLAGDAAALYEAELIGGDQRTDIALLRINTKKDLPAVELGTSGDLQVGQWVMAVGNPFGHNFSVTTGIVSAIGREIGEINRFPFIQTDASINPGNSGGPLVDTRGRVVGVNSAIDARAQGIGFAIPIDEVKSIIPILEKDGRIRRAFVGVNMYPYPLDPRQAREVGLTTTEGALVIGVLPDSPAAKVGLQEYDLIVRIDKKKVASSEDFSRAVTDLTAGQTYPLEYIRNGKKMTASITLGDHPDNDKVTQRKPRSYKGQKAPFDLGFSVTNLTAQIGNELGIPPLNRPAPVVIQVEGDSPAARAGLSMGDVIVDVNRSPVRTDIDVLKQLKKGQINSLRLLRNGYPVLVYINPKTD